MATRKPGTSRLPHPTAQGHRRKGPLLRKSPIITAKRSISPEHQKTSRLSPRDPVYQIEQNNLGFDAILGDAHEERAEKVLRGHVGWSQERNGNPANGRNRTACNAPAESEDQSTH